MKAKTWDGIGPKDDCLLRIEWESHPNSPEWVHFRWLEADWSDEGGNHDGYFDMSDSISICLESDHWSKDYGKLVPSEAFKVTHWAPLPELEES